MTTSMTPTHGDAGGPRPWAAGNPDHDGDAERWLPDPSWPVPPRLAAVGGRRICVAEPTCP